MRLDRSSLHPSDRELHELFAPRRPGAVSFEAGVRARIAAREQAAKEEDPAGESVAAQDRPAAFFRHVASIMPLGPAGASMPGSSFTKISYSVLALPVLVLVLVLALAMGTFFSSICAVLRSTRRAVPVPMAPVDQLSMRSKPLDAGLRRAGQLTAFVHFGWLTALLIGLVGGRALAMDVLTVFLVVAMGTLVLAMRGFAAAEIMSRDHVTKYVVVLLFAVHFGCIGSVACHRFAEGSSQLDIGWSAGVILLGLLTGVIAGAGWKGGLVALLPVGILCVGFFSSTRSSPASVQSQLASIELEPTDPANWFGAAALFDALRAVGETTPNLDYLEQALARSIDRPRGESPAAERVLHPVVLTAAARMGLIDDAHWARIAEGELVGYRLDLILKKGRQSWAPYFREYFVDLLLATREVSTEAHANLIANIEACRNEATGYDALATVAMCARCLDRLAASDRVFAHRDEVQDLLRDHWVRDGDVDWFEDSGGFTNNPAQAPWSSKKPTWHAIELMSRFGVPAEIDLLAVRGFLRPEARANSMLLDAFRPNRRAVPRAALLRLERELGLPARTWPAAIFGERLLIACVLLVLLCLLSIRLAPALSREQGQRRAAVIIRWLGHAPTMRSKPVAQPRAGPALTNPTQATSVANDRERLATPSPRRRPHHPSNNSPPNALACRFTSRRPFAERGRPTRSEAAGEGALLVCCEPSRGQARSPGVLVGPKLRHRALPGSANVCA